MIWYILSLESAHFFRSEVMYILVYSLDKVGQNSEDGGRKILGFHGHLILHSEFQALLDEIINHCLTE